MMQAAAVDERYNTDFASLLALREHEPEWLRDLRQRGIDAFNEMGFPTARRGNEAWKYTDIRPVAAAAYQHPAAPGQLSAAVLDARAPFDKGMARIVLLDGHFAPALSRLVDVGGLLVEPLSEAVRRHGDVVQRHLGQYAGPGHGAFVALNTALWREGAFVHATGTAAPVHIVYVTSGRDQPVVTYPRALIVAGRQAETAVIETFISLGGGNHFSNPLTEVVLEEGATVRHSRLLLENTQAYHIGHLRVRHGRDSSFETVSFQAGGGLVRVDVEAEMPEPGSSATINGVYITHGDQHVDNEINIDHAAPHTRSRLYYKGILDDRSRAVFGGTVFVRKGADKTDAHQEDKNLLLSHEAEVDSKPALEIYADDVKAGHGATAGAVADEALFYMRSRGLDEETAMQFLVRGFAAEIIDSVSVTPLREWLEQRVLAALPRFQGERAA